MNFKLLILSLFLVVPAFGQDKLLIAAASSSGTYHTMLAEISEYCSTEGGDLTITEAALSGGATENLDALANNKVSAAFVHSDVIYAMAQSDSRYRDLKTLIALYPEEIHVIALRNSITKTEGKWGTSYGAKTIEFETLADLKGFRIGAAGGGVVTARVLTGQGEGHFDVVALDSGKEVLPALDSGQIEAAIFVGGSPLANIQQLNSAKYKLIPIPEAMGAKLNGVYHSATLNYPNLKSGPIRTLAPDAIILTRKYTRPQMISPQAKFRKCFYDHLDDLKETPGKHAKWQSVDATNHGVWEWYEIGGSSSPAPIPTQDPPEVDLKSEWNKKQVHKK